MDILHENMITARNVMRKSDILERNLIWKLEKSILMIQKNLNIYVECKWKIERK
jgi:hypothetical protein